MANTTVNIPKMLKIIFIVFEYISFLHGQFMGQIVLISFDECFSVFSSSCSVLFAALVKLMLSLGGARRFLNALNKIVSVKIMKKFIIVSNQSQSRIRAEFLSKRIRYVFHESVIFRWIFIVILVASCMLQFDSCPQVS